MYSTRFPPPAKKKNLDPLATHVADLKISYRIENQLTGVWYFISNTVIIKFLTVALRLTWLPNPVRDLTLKLAISAGRDNISATMSCFYLQDTSRFHLNPLARRFLSLRKPEITNLLRDLGVVYSPRPTKYTIYRFIPGLKQKNISCSSKSRLLQLNKLAS